MGNSSLQVTNAESLAIAKQSYQDSQTRMLAQMLDIMGAQYRMTITPELARFWKQSLIQENGLSPEQIKQGFLGYMGDAETSGFPPQPGDIVRCAPETAADRPRIKKDPNCPDCRGTGWRKVSGKPHDEDRVGEVARCYCVRQVYNGQEFVPALPPAPADAEEENKQAAADLKKLANEIGPIPRKAMPRAMTDADFNEREAELRRQAEQLLKEMK